MLNPARRLAGTAVLVGMALVATGCSGTSKKTGGGDAKALTVNADDTSCEVSASTLAAGRHTFAVTNNASQVNEVYVYAVGDRIVGEVENVGPATSRNLIVDLKAGDYEVACKPGMVGKGIRTGLTITGATAAPQTTDEQLTTAVASYRGYVESETAALVATTSTFSRAILAGDLNAAKAAYATARLHYERIEPIAESFGDLDPLIDMRADDVTGRTPFSGFHAVEQLMFTKGGRLTGAAPLATALDVNVAKLAGLVTSVEITPLTMGNGAKALLDEVAKSKVTGEEERYSRIDLVDFAGNIDGAKYVFSALRPALLVRDAALVSTLDQRFAALLALLGTHAATTGDAGYVAGSPFVSYDALTPAQVRALAVEVDNLSEPLGRLSGTVTAP
jgi:iron uptake system component EfeO